MVVWIRDRHIDREKKKKDRQRAKRECTCVCVCVGKYRQIDEGEEPGKETGQVERKRKYMKEKEQGASKKIMGVSA